MGSMEIQVIERINIVYVEDEINHIENFKLSVKNIRKIRTLNCFTSPVDALEFVKNNEVDAVFLDIEMPVCSGIELAEKMQKYKKNIKVVFVTSHERYAVRSFKLGVFDYVMKPYFPSELEETINRLTREIRLKKPAIFIRTLGFFDLFINGKAVFFQNAKAKELLALLVMYRGSQLTNFQIFRYLWELKEYSNSKSTYVRRTKKALIDTLTEYGAKELVISDRNTLSINTEIVDCDFYDLMMGNPDCMQLYNGDFLLQYSWGEEGISMIENRIEQKKNHG